MKLHILAAGYSGVGNHPFQLIVLKYVALDLLNNPVQCVHLLSGHVIFALLALYIKGFTR